MTEPDTFEARLSEFLKTERQSRGWSLSDLAARSGVSRAMINKIERNQSSPTATLLVRLSSAFGLTLSTLLARAEGARKDRLLRAKDQMQWQDPDTGYVRTQIAPANGSDIPLEIVQVVLPPGKSVSMPATSYAAIRQIIWMLNGGLSFTEGDETHLLETGDSLEVGPPSDCTFANPSDTPCTYIVTVLRQR